MHGNILSIAVSHCKKNESSWAHMISYGVHIHAVCHMNSTGQKTKTPWLFWPSALKFLVYGKPAHRKFKKQRQSPRCCFHRGDSALNVTIAISMHGIIVSIAVSHCRRKVILIGANDFIWFIYRCFLSLENSKPKNIDPVVVLGGWR